MRMATLLAAGTIALSAIAVGCGSDDDDTTTAAGGASPAAKGENPETLKLAVTDLTGLEELKREFGAFERTFEEVTGKQVEFFPVADRAAAAAALASDQVDLVFTGPAEYVVMQARTDAVPVISIRRPGYRSCLYTKADSDLASPADLEGKKVGMSDVGSTSGHLGPSQLLVDAGLDPTEDVEVLTVGDAVHPALERGDIDAVGVGCHDRDEYLEGTEPGAFRTIVEGPALPPDVILARPELDEALISQIRAGFEANWPRLLAAMLEGKDNQKYEGAELVGLPQDSDYDVVRSMYKAIGVDEFSEFVGD